MTDECNCDQCLGIEEDSELAVYRELYKQQGVYESHLVKLASKYHQALGQSLKIMEDHILYAPRHCDDCGCVLRAIDLVREALA